MRLPVWRMPLADVLRLQRAVGNQAVTRGVIPTREGARPAGTGPSSGVVVQRQEMSTGFVPWTGDPLTMANTLRNLVGEQGVEPVLASLRMLWIGSIVDTLRMLRVDPAAFGTVTGAPQFAADPRLSGALDVVLDRPLRTTGLFQDQAVVLAAMQDAPSWPDIIGSQAAHPWQADPPMSLPNSDSSPDIVRRDPRYLPELYNAIRRNRAMAREFALRNRGSGYVYVGPSHKGDKPEGLDQGGEKRKAVNAAIWRELGVGEGTQASVNTYDSAKFTFGPGFAARGGLDAVMRNLAKAGSGVLEPLRNAGVVFRDNNWYVVDPDEQAVKSGKAALDVLSRDKGLIDAFLETAGDPKMRRDWMAAEWQALNQGGGAAAVPEQVVNGWDVPTVVFVAHCVHWRPALDWKHWDGPTAPDLLSVVREMAPLIDRQKDPRILTWGSAATLLGFSDRLLWRTLTASRQPQPLPDDWAGSALFERAIALPADPRSTAFFIIQSNEGN
ncbi:hypothetical protein KQY30_34910 [Streptomyces sp. GMY02]|uniref:hypothetical protein n=1 Tax=Streptomyces sp. GMY02 TaxID=1333528 RepID=UPI001C2BF8AB|nr:hypothetical protein [Streptomyces sp. GMY02]QXE38642.1 hypothetical protein KQY30_34910 [Streptomyces sp. GMY02]